MGAGRVAEVEEGLAGVHGEVSLGYPGAPGGPVRARAVEVLFGRGQGAGHGPQFSAVTLRAEGAGAPEFEEAACCRVGGPGQGVVEDLGGGGVVAALPELVGEVAEQARAHGHPAG